MRLKLGCKYCPRGFYMEFNLYSHVLFDHLHFPKNGINEEIWTKHIKLITEFRVTRKNLATYKTELKKRFLKSMYGRKYDMNNENQDYLFNSNLENHHSKLFTRLEYVRHDKYDETYQKAIKMLKVIETKGLILS